MRTDELLDDQGDELEVDDTFCTQQRPRQRCCIVWHAVGNFVVVACTHCPRVKETWMALDGDAERIAQSREAHERFCERGAWSPFPAPRQPRRASALHAG